MLSQSRSRRVLATSVIACMLLGAAACSGSDSPKKPSTSPATTASRSSTPSASTVPPTPGLTVNPYTGVGPVPTTPTISVKIDDTAPGRPQENIDKADIVYIEAVEGGLTRLAAIYGTHKPVVGYVRSTRPSDPDLLLQFGKITAAFSGGAHDSLPLMAKSGLHEWSNDAGASFYARRSHSGDEGYINLVLNLAEVAKHTTKTPVRSIGWTFSRALSGFTTSTGTDIRTYVRGSATGATSGTAVEFKWDTKLQKYVRYIGGQRQFAADGQPVSATNVVVQFCKVVAHPKDTDVNGNPSQFTYTVGTGAVAIFRNGKEIQGVWSRPGVHDVTTFKTRGGKSIPLNPGNTWVVLDSTGTQLSG